MTNMKRGRQKGQDEKISRGLPPLPLSSFFFLVVFLVFLLSSFSLLWVYSSTTTTLVAEIGTKFSLMSEVYILKFYIS
jgi:hypothetical protein